MQLPMNRNDGKKIIMREKLNYGHQLEIQIENKIEFEKKIADKLKDILEYHSSWSFDSQSLSVAYMH